MKKLIGLLVALVLLASCNNANSDKKSEGNESKAASITAAGATFPLPFYNLSFKNYTKGTGILLTYGGIGSGGGIRSLKDKVVDFGATDAFLNAEKEADMPAEIVHIPTCIGAVVIAFNLPGLEDLKLSNQNLEDIFMGLITNWDDSRLQTSNPGVSLPDIELTVVHRSDGSGTTYIFSDFMSKISTSWEAEVGRGKSLKWPVGLGAKGNPGVAGTIQQTKGSVGYIGSEFAFAQKISFAQVENSAGEFILPSLESISAAAKGDIPEDTKVMLTNSSDPEAYPISGFTWLILYKEQSYDGRSKVQAEETVKFLNWIIDRDAQALAQQVNYAPLPDKVVENARQILGEIVFKGEKLLLQ
ncbi:MAG: phosphate ABC transporter substrate-binding protein PstS [Bacteroidetes bacterium]|jgi:phosphate transport system substrate-binding protein|nr:phosphate ABC transporter substrate-binding protein PstS [Bacteroidota bacterium]MBT7465173.1 phosphate ABC transporter substrate-binding protein PstS [Bacteroidota bacterium]